MCILLYNYCHMPRRGNSRTLVVPEPSATPAAAALEGDPQLVDEVVRVHDATRHEEGVHLFLERLISFEHMTEIYGGKAKSRKGALKRQA